MDKDTKVTLKRPMAITASRGNDMGTYTIAARAIQGQVVSPVEDGEVRVDVHTAFVFERDGSVTTHHVGEFQRSLDQCQKPTPAGVTATLGTDRNRWELARLAYWALANRTPTRVTIKDANIDGEEQVAREDSS